MKKRILTLLTVITILAGIVVPARAEETVPEEPVQAEADQTETSPEEPEEETVSEESIQEESVRKNLLKQKRQNRKDRPIPTSLRKR